ncbi:hypothetical protein A2791_03665 [Candidatus Saccharibacteria bacterium RIFCSPHIGHO2_01_FULL_46_30]|nr:MAG: hypothetical protein A2791_03665 [Candidatus Saccharibacteria bacterium RIFCSPHIGHO2_01_FULL_46_30]
MFFSEARKKRERIIALDLLRGTFLMVIFINHIAWSPTLFDFITGQSHLFASAAEGFFAISGILVGYIYAPRVLKKTKDTFIKLWKRAGWLYLLSISFTCLYSFITLFLPPETVRSQFLYPTFGEFALNTLTLQFSYGWADFLSRYALLMAFAPFAIWLVAKGKSLILAVISILVWLFLSQGPYSHFTAWQIIFYISVIIGYYLPTLEYNVQSLSKSTKKIAAAMLFTVTAITFTGSIILTVLLPIVAGEFKGLVTPDAYVVVLNLIDIRTHLDQTIFNRDTMAVGRLLIGMVWFTTLYILFRRHERLINKKTKGSLLLLGMNSLYVYGLQSVIIFTMDIFFDPPEGANIIVKTVVVALCLYLVYVLTYQRSFFKRIRQSIFSIWSRS